MSNKMNKEEEDWKAESDAITIAEYNAIINDKPRLKRALEKAKEQVKDLSQRAKALGQSITGLDNGTKK